MSFGKLLTHLAVLDLDSPYFSFDIPVLISIPIPMFGSWEILMAHVKENKKENL